MHCPKKPVWSRRGNFKDWICALPASWRDGETVFFHHGAELVAEPVGGEAEFPERVVMGAFVFEGFYGRAGDLGGGLGAEGNPKVAKTARYR